MASQLVKIEKRQGFGTKGRPIGVIVNCFEMTQKPDGMIHHYDVKFSDPALKDKRVIMTYLVGTMRIFGDASIGAVFDGQANLYVHGAKVFDSQDFPVSESEAKGRPQNPKFPSNKNLIVTITCVNAINMMALAQYVNGGANTTEEISQAISALNIAIKHAPYATFPSRKNNFYIEPSAQERRLLGAGLEAWAAYFSSMRPGIGKMFMNFDRGAGAFKQSGNIIAISLNFIGRRDPRDLQLSRMPPRERLRYTRFIKGLIVNLQFARTQGATYKIRKVSEISAAEFTFEKEPGVQQTVAQYIQEKYNIQLAHPYMPCVQLTKIAWYPLECVMIAPGTQFLGKLSPSQVTEMLKFTTQKPAEKLNSLRIGLRHMQFGGQSETLRRWHLDVASAPMNVNARLLEAPRLHYGDQRSGQPAMVEVKDGAWDIKFKTGSKSPEIPIARWFVVVFAEEGGRDSYPKRDCQNSISDFVKGCQQYGIKISNERPYISYAGDCREVEVFEKIKDAAKKAGYGPKEPPQLVLTYCLSKTSKQYGSIKSVCDTIFGVPSQNLTIQKTRNAKNQYYSNVALKVNVKLSGVNQIIARPVRLPGMDRPTIIFGADVTHPGPGSLFPSIAAVVASCDNDAVQYATAARVQNSREEIIVNLQEMAMELITNFGRKTKQKPARIIFFRDGVSEGQFDEVCRTEISALKRAIQGLGKEIDCAITYIICGKRHHIRFFPKDPKDGDRSGNVKAGTVIDTDIAHPYYNDFYLLSHAGLLGTSRPTHYSVLLDECKLGADELQKLAFYLAHLYPRATRSVSIAAPAYFAHHLCTRAKHYIGEDDSASEISAGATPDQIDAIRNEKLISAQRSLKTVHPQLASTMYFF